MGKRQKQKFNLRISSVTENLEIIRDFISRIALKGGFDSENADQVALAVDEACTNVIKHAHHHDARRMIDINVFLLNDRIRIDVTDTGKGFDPKNLSEPNLAKYAQEARHGGLGIHLMRSLMDEVHYDFKTGKKNRVSLVKYLNKQNA
ncbi:MAG: ATP-binding protein [Caldithrix sp.]|nr:ATP-binding protein [Caldithrix sp.]